MEIPIRGHESYLITDCGQVISTMFNKRRILKQHPDRYGYLMVTLYRGSISTRVTKWAHQLVAQHFIGHRPAGLQCCHNDGNCQNNMVENLRYDTPRENQLDRWRF